MSSPQFDFCGNNFEMVRAMRFSMGKNGDPIWDYSGYGLPINEIHICQSSPCGFMECLLYGKKK